MVTNLSSDNANYFIIICLLQANKTRHQKLKLLSQSVLLFLPSVYIYVYQIEKLKH